jgi:hypothetical protein
VDDVFWACHHPTHAPNLRLTLRHECERCPLWEEAARFREARRPDRDTVESSSMNLRVVTISQLQAAHDRRDDAGREALLRRIRNEFEELPGMRLTCPQLQRLFGLRPDVCERVLAALMRDKFLCRTSSDRYRLNDSSAWPGPRVFSSRFTSATPKAS